MTHLAQPFVGRAHHRHVGNRRVVEQAIFNLRRVAVETAADVHVLQAVGDLEVAPIVQNADVAGLEPTVRGDGGGSGRRIVQVALHDVEAAHPDLTGIARRHRTAVAARDSDLDPAHGSSAGVGDGLQVIPRPAHRHHPGGLGQAVGRVNLLKAEPLLHVPDQLHGHRRCPGHRAAQ